MFGIMHVVQLLSFICVAFLKMVGEICHRGSKLGEVKYCVLSLFMYR